MLKSEMQHQFWVTRKSVQRRLGTKEDKFIISSDAELDSKIEIFKSINDTSAQLTKVIDQYQERLCVLSQEMCVFGRFLKEIGKRSKTTGNSITNSGKAIFYSGQQMTSIRIPLVRLHQEVDVFRIRAVRDTQNTIQNMEGERTEYRAALSWIKSVSSTLDPDTGKGLNKFRAAQAHVRMSKQNFDRCALNTIQKIDLLAASRCNMFSHALLSYVNHLNLFVKKTASTFEAVSNSFTFKPSYDFCVLKGLSQNDNDIPKCTPYITVDRDQQLFFADDYGDVKTDELSESEWNITVDGIAKSIPKPVIKQDWNEEVSRSSNSTNNWTKILESELSCLNDEKQQNSILLGPNIINKNQTELNSIPNPWIELFTDKDTLLAQDLITSKFDFDNSQNI